MKLFRRKKKVEEQKAIEMEDILCAMQIFINTINRIVDQSGWDVSKWNMSDLNEFIQATTRIGNMEGK